MKEICVEWVEGEYGEKWWVYDGDEPIAVFYSSREDAEAYADMKRLEA